MDWRPADGVEAVPLVVISTAGRNLIFSESFIGKISRFPFASLRASAHRNDIMIRLGVMLVLAFLVMLVPTACDNEFRERPESFPEAIVLVPDAIPAIGATQIRLSVPIDPSGLEILLADQAGKTVLGTAITGEHDVNGAITEATFTPAYGLTDGADYTLRVTSEALDFTKTVRATSTFTYVPGIYLTTFSGQGLEDISSEIRTWFVEFTEPDEDGRVEVWHIDGDHPSEGGEPVCFGWSVDLSKSGKPAIGFATRGTLQLDAQRRKMTTVQGGEIGIDATVACICNGRYVEQAVPSGPMIGGRIDADGICFCGYLPSFSDYATYVGKRCPDGTVLPHPEVTQDPCRCSIK